MSWEIAPHREKIRMTFDSDTDREVAIAFDPEGFLTFADAVAATAEEARAYLAGRSTDG